MVQPVEDAPGRAILGPRAKQAALIFYNNREDTFTPDEIGKQMSLKALSIRPAITALKKTEAIVIALDERGRQLPTRSTGHGGKSKPLIWNPMQDEVLSWERINAIEEDTVQTVGDILEQTQSNISAVFNNLEEDITIMPNGNLDLWTSVEKTDPSHTKKVNQRGGFTAIDAYHQIRNATEQFGPVGVGWGWTVQSISNIADTCIVTIDMWHGNRENTFSSVGQATVKDTKDRLDSDAVKKALTDSITKGLSYLGFNTDVFLGKFDDNKYVQERTAEVKEEASAESLSPFYDEEMKKGDERQCNTFILELEEMVTRKAAMTAINKKISDFNMSGFKEIAKRNPSLNAAVRSTVATARKNTVE